MALSLADAIKAYGFVGQLTNAIPELRGLLSQAAQQEWSPDTLDNAIRNSTWWKRNGDAARNLAIAAATDPATYSKNLRAATGKVDLLARSMGLAPMSAARAQQVAMHFIVSGYDETTMRSWLARNVGLGKGEAGALQGDAAQFEEHIKQVADNYGVPMSQAWVQSQIKNIQTGTNTMDGVEAVLRARAKAAFPHLADQLDAGMNVREIADPYIATMSQTLEMAETDIDLSNPEIKRALQVKDAKTGAFSTKPMWQFQRELKDDARWDSTNNAKQEAYSMVQRLGKDMGFLS